MSTHSIEAKKFLGNSERASWHNDALFFVRMKRDKQASDVPEWEDLRKRASQIKRHTITNLPVYLEAFERNCLANGVRVHWAADASDMNEAVFEIIKEHGAHRLVKSKSMLSEECGMAPYLEERGIDVVESDLGERIMQFLHEPPSHIVLPAIAVKREEVADVFAKEIGSDANNSDPTYLTHQARRSLREIFLNSTVAMTGVNFAVADTGAFCVCTNEGNADMGTSFAKVQISIMGIEKLVPDYESLGVFLRLLARSATGQASTTYTSLYKKPVEGQEMHIIIVDNGRSRILADKEHNDMLKCIRCGACMNTCPVYRRTGGYSYSYFIPGPVGINLGMLADIRKYCGNLSACSLCYGCQNVCPAKVTLADQIYLWRQDLEKYHLADPMKKTVVKAMNLVMRRPALFNTAIKCAPIIEKMPRALVYAPINAWGRGRDLPPFPSRSFADIWKSTLSKEK